MNESNEKDLLFDYLDGTLSPEERRAFEVRLAHNPALREELEGQRALQRLIDRTERPVAPHALRQSIRAQLDREVYSPRVVMQRRIYRLAQMAALLAVVVIGATVYRLMDLRDGAEDRLGKAERQQYEREIQDLQGRLTATPSDGENATDDEQLVASADRGADKKEREAEVAEDAGREAEPLPELELKATPEAEPEPVRIAEAPEAEATAEPVTEEAPDLQVAQAPPEGTPEPVFPSAAPIQPTEAAPSAQSERAVASAQPRVTPPPASTPRPTLEPLDPMPAQAPAEPSVALAPESTPRARNIDIQPLFTPEAAVPTPQPMAGRDVAAAQPDQSRELGDVRRSGQSMAERLRNIPGVSVTEEPALGSAAGGQEIASATPPQMTREGGASGLRSGALQQFAQEEPESPPSGSSAGIRSFRAEDRIAQPTQQPGTTLNSLTQDQDREQSTMAKAKTTPTRIDSRLFEIPRGDGAVALVVRPRESETESQALTRAQADVVKALGQIGGVKREVSLKTLPDGRRLQELRATVPYSKSDTFVTQLRSSGGYDYRSSLDGSSLGRVLERRQVEGAAKGLAFYERRASARPAPTELTDRTQPGEAARFEVPSPGRIPKGLGDGLGGAVKSFGGQPSGQRPEPQSATPRDLDMTVRIISLPR